ncbi:MAG: SIMPL domain-containing protein [Trueperaceae bacterium]
MPGHRFWALFIVPFLAAALPSAAVAQQAATPAFESIGQPAAVSVVGHGVVYGEPDVASLELGVTVSDPDVRAAVGRLDESIAAVMAALSDMGVPERSIQTTSFNVWREERFPQDGNRDAVAQFRAQHMLRVELEGARRAGEVLSAAVESGANAIGGITFGFSNSAELAREAREAAFADARAKAEHLAAIAGVSLGAPLTIEDLDPASGPSPMFERAATMMSDSSIATGELAVEARVAVRYRIEAP